MEEKMITVPAVERTLDILEALTSDGIPKSLGELAAELMIPQASLFRILKNLLQRGYVEMTGQAPAKYAPGYRLMQLLTDYKSRFSLQEVLRPVMEELSRETGQTSQFAVYRNHQFLYTEQVISEAPVNVIARLYAPLEINTSAGAKCILANMAPEFRKEYLKAIDLKARTAKTVTDSGRLLAELEAIKEQGYALDDEEFAEGIGCIAMPVFADGVCCGALGITGAIADYKNKKSFAKLKLKLLAAADRLGGMM